MKQDERERFGYFWRTDVASMLDGWGQQQHGLPKDALIHCTSRYQFSTSVTPKTCPVKQKRGKRRGQPCGYLCPAGERACCRRHTKLWLKTKEAQQFQQDMDEAYWQDVEYERTEGRFENISQWISWLIDHVIQALADESIRPELVSLFSPLLHLSKAEFMSYVKSREERNAATLNRLISQNDG